MANIGINITENGTTTLATAGKYCDRNIDVNVEIKGGAELEQLSITANGTYTADEGKGYSPVIVNVPQDGSPTSTDLIFTGNIDYLFAESRWDWVLEKFGNLITFSNISSIRSLFTRSVRSDLSFLTIPIKDSASINSMFEWCQELVKLPKVIGKPQTFSGLFTGCNCLTTEEINKFLEPLETIGGSQTNSSIFSGCRSVRDLTYALDWMDNAIQKYTGTSQSVFEYSQAFYNTHNLDKIDNLYFFRAKDIAKTSNAFSTTFNYSCRLKDMKFKTDNGTPYIVKWKSQTIDLTNYIGWAYQLQQILSYNSGITADKEVIDDATYQALKNDEDWFTCDVNYSRYNHDSAVNTINSLPDTSAFLSTNGGTNTIKFKGAAGTNTDGGAINTLTDEEIAVAAAKGWTVSLV